MFCKKVFGLGPNFLAYWLAEMGLGFLFIFDLGFVYNSYVFVLPMISLLMVDSSVIGITDLLGLSHFLYFCKYFLHR